MNQEWPSVNTTDISNPTENSLSIKKFILKIECPTQPI
jgi:hypothetical protein